MAATADKEFLIRVRADIQKAAQDMRRMADEIGRSGQESKRASRDIDGVGRSIDFLKRAAGAYLSLRFAQQILQTADAYQNLQTRLRTATRESGDYLDVQREIFRISQDNGAALETTVALFQSLARSGPELRATNGEILEVTRAVQQLGVISGASQQAMAAGLLQFSQGLASGVFRAEEFNSILENVPELAVRIAKGMGMSVGELRKGVLEGKVLSREVFDALLSQTGEINQQFGEIPDRLDRAMQTLGNSMARLLGHLDEASGTTETIAININKVARFIDGQLATGQERIDYLLEQEQRLVAELERLQGLNIDPFKQANLQATLQRYREEIAAIRTELEATAKGGAAAGGTAEGGGKTEQASEEAQKLIDKLQLQAATLGMTSREVELYRLQITGASSAQMEAAGELLDLIAAEQDFEAAVQASEEAVKRENEAYQEWIKTLREEGREVYAATRTDMEKMAAEMERLDRLYQAGAIDVDTYARALFDAAEKYDKMAEDGEDAFARLEAATRGWGDQFTNTMADMVQTGKLEFSDLADSIISDLLRILIYQNLTKPLFGGLGIPGFGDGTASVNHTGGIAGSGSGTRRSVAMGAFAGAPRYHFGGFAGLKPNEVPAILEQGEEVLPRSDPRHAANQGAGGGSVRVELVNRGTPKQAQSADVRFEGRDMVVTVMTEDLQRGGPISGSLERTFGLQRRGG